MRGCRAASTNVSFKHWVLIFGKTFVNYCCPLALKQPYLFSAPLLTLALSHLPPSLILSPPMHSLCLSLYPACSFPPSPHPPQSEIEGHPDVQISLTSPKGCPLIDHLIVHPCVCSADALVLQSHSPASTDTFRKIRFSGPLEPFDLCHYTIPAPPPLPIDSYYQMKVHVEWSGWWC